MKKILLIPIFFMLALGFAACSDDEKDLRIELARPLDVTVTTELAVATFKWPSVDKTGGYAYALDDSEDYEILDAEQTSVTLSGLSRGLHTFKIYSVGIEGKSFDSAVREVEFEINPSVATPIVSYSIERVNNTHGNVIISWDRITGAMGYAYKVGDEEEWTRVGANELSLTLENISYSDQFPFIIKAIGNPPISDDSAIHQEDINLKTAVGVWIIFTVDGEGRSVELTEAETGIYTATISCLASDAFYINIENTKYGFMSYSGNGGVGIVNSEFAAVPFYNNSRAVYNIRESIGLIDSASPINNFYTNVDARCEVFVQIDTNGDKPSYYLRLEEEKDPSIVLAQYFDLMAYGGDWTTYIKGTAYSGGQNIGVTDTGLSGGNKDGASATAFGCRWIETGFAPDFVKNKGMEGWSFENMFEFAGYMRLSNTNASSPQYGVLTTPALGSASNLEVTFDGMLFASFKDVGENAFIEVKVLNGGKVTSAKVAKDGGDEVFTIEPVGNDAIHIVSKYHTNYANAAIKEWSNYTFTIEGATVDTQITWNCKTNSSIPSAHYRYCIDNIVVKKK